jgi:1,4-alpha-glucan branching enzyme
MSRLALVLHTHMPYVEGFGTWPFGEEWLFEAAATVYVPLLGLLDEREDAARGLTLSVTPVLADQLLADGVHERLLTFLRDLRVTTHALDAAGCREGGERALGDEVERAGGDYARAADALEALGAGGLARGLLKHAAWTSSATHAVLPLVATDAGVRLQLRAGIEAHRARRDGAWGGGFWLPECAHAPWLHPLLEEAGVHATCVDLTDVLPGARTPLATEDGPLLVPLDREVIELVWSDGGYPAGAAYRDTHRMTVHHHHPWANDGAVYDRDRAREQAAADARDFVARVAARGDDGGGGLSVCALDTELLGHHWYEGLDWLRAVLDEAPRAGVELVALDDALHDTPVVAAPEDLPTTTWGQPRTLWTWDGPQVAGLAFATRAAELRVVAAGARADARAIRELLALQSSDWAFLVTRDISGPYPRERADAHAAALTAALAAPGEHDPALRALAPFADPAMLLAP